MSILSLVKPKIAWYGKHFGEEPPLVGDKTQGAGTIFFSGCNLRCVFCQNFQISQNGFYKKQSKELFEIMLELQNQGAINIDLVTPLLWWKQIKEAIIIAKEKGLTIPIVWNSNGYESVEIISEMNGLIDIYLPDFKYGNDELALKYSKVKDYTQTAKNALSEMIKQVGIDLLIKNHVANKGIIVRHLVLPNHLENTKQVLKILSEIDKNVTISLMNQFQPVFFSESYSEINRHINKQEWQKVLEYMDEYGLENGWVQELDDGDNLLPDFQNKNPFLKFT